MMNFMVVTVVEGNPHADFFSKLSDAENYRMDVVCGMGGRAQVYQLVSEHGNTEYQLMYE